MAKPDCDKLNPDLSAYLDGELAGERERRVARHLAECEDCRRLLEQLRAVHGALAELPRLRAPADLTAALRHAAERRLATERRASGWSRVWRLRVVLQISASAALLAFCTFVGWKLIYPPSVAQRPLIPTDASQLAFQDQKTLDDAGGAKQTEEIAALAPRGGAAPARDERENLPSAATPPPTVAWRTAAKPAEQAVNKSNESPSAAAQVVTIQPTDPAAWDGPGRFLQDAVTRVPLEAPAVSCVITPQTPQQYRATVSICEDWSRAVPVLETRAGGLPAYAGGKADAAQGGGADETVQMGLPVAHEITLQVPPSQVPQLIAQLQEHAPQQVNVALLFKAEDLGYVEQLAQSPAAPRNEVDEGAATLAGKADTDAENLQKPPEVAGDTGSRGDNVETEKDRLVEPRADLKKEGPAQARAPAYKPTAPAPATKQPGRGQDEEDLERMPPSASRSGRLTTRGAERAKSAAESQAAESDAVKNDTAGDEENARKELRKAAAPRTGSGPPASANREEAANERRQAAPRRVSGEKQRVDEGEADKKPVESGRAPAKKEPAPPAQEKAKESQDALRDLAALGERENRVAQTPRAGGGTGGGRRGSGNPAGEEPMILFRVTVLPPAQAPGQAGRPPLPSSSPAPSPAGSFAPPAAAPQTSRPAEKP